MMGDVVALLAMLTALLVVLQDTLELRRETKKWRQTGRCPTCRHVPSGPTDGEGGEPPDLPSGWAV